jgi:hypothetical protein
VRINKQSPDFAGGVHVVKEDMDVDAGDQGIMFGYANDERFRGLVRELKRSGFSVQGCSAQELKAAGVTASDEHVGSTAQELKRSGFSVQGLSAQELKASGGTAFDKRVGSTAQELKRRASEYGALRARAEGRRRHCLR